MTCLGEGCGANIAARFAMKHPNRCQGVILVHPTGSTASFMETIKDKINSWLPKNNNSPMSQSAEAYLIWHRYGQSNQLDHLVQSNIKEYREKLYKDRNQKNLSLLIDAFLK